MFEKTNHKIVIGDSRNMQHVSDGSVQLIITSPPYWQLKDYGVERQIGYNQSYEEYINHLNLVWQESFRVLEDGGRLCVNIGDQYARAVYYGRYKVIPIRTEIIKFCEATGFDYMGAIIWQKKTTTNTTGGASLMGSYPYPRNGIVSLDYEFILLFKKPGKPSRVSKEIKEQSRLTKEEWKTYFSGHWYFGGARQKEHLAVFPDELPKRLIKMFSFVGDTVLDPFLGSGTTSAVAKKLGRNSIGYEINEEFLSLIRQKLEIDTDVFNGFEIIHDNSQIDFNKAIQKLPYVFRDLNPLHLQTDPKKLNFGSKIDKETSAQRQEFFKVKEIVSPNLIRLDNDLLVRLIGVIPKKDVNGEAIEFLKQKTKRQKIFLKFDRNKYDKNGRLMAYVYLKNKTFLNAHLIKKGMAEVDASYDFKYKEKFYQYVKLNNDE